MEKSDLEQEGRRRNWCCQKMRFCSIAICKFVHQIQHCYVCGLLDAKLDLGRLQQADA